MKRLLALGLALLATGCAHHTIRKAPQLDTAPPQRIAVMPPDPGVAPPEAAIFTRGQVVADLSRRGYQVMPNEQVDVAAQSAASAQSVAQAVPSDAVLYTRITQYAVNKSLFNTETTFGVMFTLIGAQGEELWLASATLTGGSSGRSPLGGDSLAVGVVNLAVDAANAKTAAEAPPFLEVAQDAIGRAIYELPKGPLAR